jgi:predicted dehydrogenase
MRVGILSFAHVHASSYASALMEIEGVDLVGIFDERKERGEKAAKQFQTIYYPKYVTLLEKGLDAVVVTSENVKHKEHVVAAARHGAAVLCEKPLAHTMEDAQEMIRVCEEEGVLLQTAFPVRFNQAIRRAKERIDKGEIGELLAIKGTNRGKNPGGWFVDKSLSGGGAVIDHTVHVVDIMRWVTGSEVQDVYAEIDELFTDHSIEDSGLLTMTFDNGIFATLDCSWSRHKNFPIWGDVTIEFIGTKGTLYVDAQAQKLDVYHRHGLDYQFWGENMDAGLIQDFISSVRNKSAPSITGLDGLRAVEVALGAYKSVSEKQAVKIVRN